MTEQTRREFLKMVGAAVGGAAIGGVSVLTWTGARSSTNTSGPVASDGGSNTGSSEPTAPTWQEIDAKHKAVVAAFPAKTEKQGNQPLAPRLEDGAKVFDLTVEEIQWEVTPGNFVAAMSYNGTLPGPIIRVTEGDRVRVNVTNKMSQSTAVHWHGLRVPNKMDGVPFITQDPIPPGGTFTYEFVARPFGSHMYHSHYNSTYQVSMGLLGALIVDPKDPRREPKADKEWLFILNDGPHGYTINGKGFPATQPMVAKLGERIRIRFMNEGAQYHPFHLHGMHMEVFARDGYPLPQPFLCDTLTLGPGERWDAIVVADEPGVWAFHCHVLPHAEGEGGMFGMVTALIVEA